MTEDQIGSIVFIAFIVGGIVGYVVGLIRAEFMHRRDAEVDRSPREIKQH